MRKSILAQSILMFLMVAVSLYGFTQLSGEIAIHFDSSGKPDNYVSVFPALLFIPALSVLILTFFNYLPRIDPLGENYESFEDVFDMFKVLILGVFTYLQAVIVAWNLGFEYNPALLVTPVVFSVYFLSAKIIERAERNWFVGIRTPWTLSSDEVWKKTHEKSAPLMMGAAFISLLAAIVPEYSVYFYAAPAAAISLFSTVYSYWLYRKKGGS